MARKLKKLRPNDHISGKMFITNSRPIAGATSSPPRWRPQALTTAVSATSATAASATQKAAPSGRASTAAGIAITATSSARRQFDQPGRQKPGRGSCGRRRRTSLEAALIDDAGSEAQGLSGVSGDRERDPRAALPACGSGDALLDPAGFRQQVLLEGGDVVERLLGRRWPVIAMSNCSCCSTRSSKNSGTCQTSFCQSRLAAQVRFHGRKVR